MQDFIDFIVSFLRQLAAAISTAFNYNETVSNNYSTWLNKPIISGDLITIGMNWRELFLFGSTWFIAIFFIVFVFHVVYKIIGLFKI